MTQAPYMADSPVSVHKPGTMAQAAVAATIPEGMLIAPIWKRMVALALDAFLITLIIAAVSRMTFYNYLMAVDLLLTGTSSLCTRYMDNSPNLLLALFQVHRAILRSKFRSTSHEDCSCEK